MINIEPYLNFNGNCEEAFNFYKSVFGGDFGYIGRFGEMPPQEGIPPMDEEFKKRIMHISLKIGQTMLMGSDTGGDWAPTFTMGNNITLNLNAENKKEADDVFKKLSAGGKVIMPMQETFWKSYYGMFTDKFGVNWMINTQLSDKK